MPSFALLRRPNSASDFDSWHTLQTLLLRRTLLDAVVLYPDAVEQHPLYAELTSLSV